MKWDAKEEIDRWKWRRSFALFPVKTIENKWVWLEKVWSRERSLGFNGRYEIDYSSSVKKPMERDEELELLSKNRPSPPKPCRD